jgi:hypothetical protein
LLGDDALPIGPAEAYLAYLQVSASPNTVQAYAHDLRDFFTWVSQTGLDWNSYRVKRPGDHGSRHHGPATISLVNHRSLTLAA